MSDVDSNDWKLQIAAERSYQATADQERRDRETKAGEIAQQRTLRVAAASASIVEIASRFSDQWREKCVRDAEVCETLRPRPLRSPERIRVRYTVVRGCGFEFWSGESKMRLPLEFSRHLIVSPDFNPVLGSLPMDPGRALPYAWYVACRDSNEGVIGLQRMLENFAAQGRDPDPALAVTKLWNGLVKWCAKNGPEIDLAGLNPGLPEGPWPSTWQRR